MGNIECCSCGEDLEKNECPNSKRECGHHCNHSWTQDECCWCGKEFGDDENKEYEKCCCFNCGELIDEKSSPDCACDDAPFYESDKCGNCPKRSFCDVPENPSLYKQDT